MILVLLVIGLASIWTMLVAMYRKIGKIVTRSSSEEFQELKQGFQDFGRGSAVSSGILSAKWTEINDNLKGLRAEVSELKGAVIRIQEKLT